MRESRFDTDVVEINYGESQPGGRPFVILHGGAASWHYNEALINLLASSWHVFAPDFRGHGKSGRTPGHYLLIDYVSDTAKFLRGVVREPVVVYGHSLGGEVAMMLASDHPELVRAVIDGDAPLSIEDHLTELPHHRRMNELWHGLAGRPVYEIVPALKAMEVPVPGGLLKRAEDVFGQDSPWFEFQARNLHDLDPDMLAAVLRGPGYMLGGYDPEKILPRIRCPVLVLQADPVHGSALRDQDIERRLQLIPHATHVKLLGVGHELQGPQPQRIFEAIAPFLTSL